MRRAFILLIFKWILNLRIEDCTAENSVIKIIFVNYPGTLTIDWKINLPDSITDNRNLHCAAKTEAADNYCSIKFYRLY